MKKPKLIVVTGRPGAGKTTLAEKLSREWYLPLVSRDRVKEGYVHTVGVPHDALPQDANLLATKAFFETIGFMLERNITVIAEAAFQHKVWESFLQPLSEKAEIVLVICRVDGALALDRFLERGLNEDERGYFHGDKGVQMLKSGVQPMVGDYNEPKLSYRTVIVDTSDGYSPTLDVLRETVLDDL